MRRVLIVSPHFPPVNAPDMQRVRLALPHFRSFGWDPYVLAVGPDMIEGAVIEPILEKTYPADIPVLRVGGIPSRLTRRFGFGSVWWRCGGALRRAGDALLRAEKFDLVFFSTTQFDAFTLGPRWLARYGVPYVLDYQDPWVNDYYARTRTRPPGGQFKFWVSQFTARRREPAAVASASAIISVSSSYGPDLLSRYPGLDPARLHHLPFGAAASDLAIARAHRPTHSLVPAGDGRIHFVYTGRCGPDMSLALGVLFQAFKRYRQTHSSLAARMHFHFIGTDYAPPPLGRYWALPIAEQEGVLDQVSEHCYRIPYFESLHYLTSADALLALGSNDPTYSASKIFPYLLSRRPLLTIVHEESLMLELVRDQKRPNSYGFSLQSSDRAQIVQSIYDEWFVAEGYRKQPDTTLPDSSRYTAAGMTERLASLFDQAVKTPGP